jgi:hypothetical protein
LNAFDLDQGFTDVKAGRQCDHALGSRRKHASVRKLDRDPCTQVSEIDLPIFTLL